MMNGKFLKIDLSWLTRVILLVMSFSLLATDGNGQAPSYSKADVGIVVQSAEIRRFSKAIRLTGGLGNLEYQEALVLKVRVNGEEFDSLPPSVEPQLFIGDQGYRIFHIDRREDNKELILTFHVRDWTRLKDEAPMILTLDYRASSNITDQKEPRFNKSMIVDKRSDNGK
jgi:hypothetical protein